MDPKPQQSPPLPPAVVAEVTAALRALRNPETPADRRQEPQEVIVRFLQEHLFAMARWRARNVAGLSAGDLFQSALLNVLGMLGVPDAPVPQGESPRTIP